MAQESCSDADFIALWDQVKSAKDISKILNITERRVLARRRSLEKRKDINLHSINKLGLNCYNNKSASAIVVVNY
jgi:hypothetical protein